MDDLIEALAIFRSYCNTDTDGTYHFKYPTHCEHDVLTVIPGYPIDRVSESDKTRLEELSFIPSDEFSSEGAWISHRFGSC